MSKLGKENWTVVKRMFRCLHGTTDHAICYQGRDGLDRVLDVHGFVDVDWAGDLDHRRSTSGYVFNLLLRGYQLDKQETGCSGTINYRS